jgi:pimeloyl-ACP methyl ester carboxylesterase
LTFRRRAAYRLPVSAEGWTHRTAEANGIRLHYVEQGEGVPVLLLHGFPELWYSWRHQIPALAAGGLRAIAPDLRGYGESDKPAAIEEYSIQHLVGDVVGLLDALEIDKAVIAGHDWGSIVMWSALVMHPQRFERAVSFNVPYRGRCSGFPPTEVLEKLRDRYGYVLFFQEPGRAERSFAEDLPAKLRRFYNAAAASDSLLSDEEFQVYLSAYEKGGVSGPINYYRNIDRNWKSTEHLADAVIECPTMLVMADKDVTLPLRIADGIEKWLPNLRREVIEGCGHWTQQEKPEQANALLLDFLADPRSGGRPSER